MNMELISRLSTDKHDVPADVQTSFCDQDRSYTKPTVMQTALDNNEKPRHINIEFENLTYIVKSGFFKRENRAIIKGVTGEFRSGELSAVVGPSGAGKSSLLKILCGYEVFGINGGVLINGTRRDANLFRKNLSFITQDTDLQPFLTISEAMYFSVNLKLGNNWSKQGKKERVAEVLKSVGIFDVRHNATGKLSGGEKKRLAIALELVNNPAVLILDEPTTGLDSSTANQCISLLKKLASEGRTIICTIHQPSGIAIQMFDLLYAIACGECIFSGGTKYLVPFLASVGLNCPESYNPVDFLMEIATDDYGKQVHRLTKQIDKGRNKTYRKNTYRTNNTIEDDETRCLEFTAKDSQMESIPEWKFCNTAGSVYPNERYSQHKPKSSSSITDGNCNKPKKPALHIDTYRLCKRNDVYNAAFHLQILILLERNYLLLWRDKGFLFTRFGIHFIMAAVVGVLYYGIGNDAANALNNFRYIFYTIMFLMYTAFSSILVNFPLEFPIVTREHFNRWYSLRAYFIAFTIADIPIQMMCTSMFIAISYSLTGQPTDFIRLLLFTTISFLTTLVAQSIGLTVGASLSIKYGAIFGPFFICPFLAFSGFFLQQNDAQEWLKWLFNISFLKYGLEGSTMAIFGYNRTRLECNEIYCHFSRPQIFLKNIGMENGNYETCVIFLVLVFFALRVVAFYLLSLRIRLFR